MKHHNTNTIPGLTLLTCTVTLTAFISLSACLIDGVGIQICHNQGELIDSNTFEDIDGNTLIIDRHFFEDCMSSDVVSMTSVSPQQEQQMQDDGWNPSLLSGRTSSITTPDQCHIQVETITYEFDSDANFIDISWDYSAFETFPCNKTTTDPNSLPCKAIQVHEEYMLNPQA